MFEEPKWRPPICDIKYLVELIPSYPLLKPMFIWNICARVQK